MAAGWPCPTLAGTCARPRRRTCGRDRTRACCPGPVLIADRDNNRLLEVSPQGVCCGASPHPAISPPARRSSCPTTPSSRPTGARWSSPRRTTSRSASSTSRADGIVYRYGHPGVPGSEPGYVHNPDDAMLTPSGELITADIKNCRVLVIRPPAHRPLRQLGVTGDCEHEPGAPTAAPTAPSRWPTATRRSPRSTATGWTWSPPAAGPCLDTNPPGLHLPVGHQRGPPRAVPVGRLHRSRSDRDVHRRRPAALALRAHRRRALNQPSLALPLPNGDILANDDKNDRVIVVDPRTNKIVWQYGHTARARLGRRLPEQPRRRRSRAAVLARGALRRQHARALSRASRRRGRSRPARAA